MLRFSAHENASDPLLCNYQYPILGYPKIGFIEGVSFLKLAL